MCYYKNIVFYLVLTFMLVASCSEKELSSEKDKPVNFKIHTWATPAEQKIKRDEQIEINNLVWSEETNTINIFGAGNENASFQLIVSTRKKPSQEIERSHGYLIEFSDLISQNNNKISKENIDTYLEHYIQINATSSPVGEVGYWADALVPIKSPFSIGTGFGTTYNTPVWINVSIPTSTPRGIYKGRITITQNGKPVNSLLLEVEVFNFSLPKETSLITYINVPKNQLAKFYGKPSNSDDIVRLTEKYHEYLYKSRMEPWFNDMLEPVINVKGKDDIKLFFDDERYLYYMNVLNSKRVLLDAFPWELGKHVYEYTSNFTPVFNQMVKSYLIQVESYFKKHGWEDRLVFNSPIDEPNSLEDFEDTRKWATLVNEATPNIPFLATITPVTPKNNWGTLRGFVDNFSIHGNALNDSEVSQVIQEEKEKGGELTWYISCDQKYPQPNYFIDAPAMDPVMVPWITAAYEMDGILYWAINWWNETTNPWEDANTFHSGASCSGGWTLNGEGSLWYPGDKAKKYTGQPSVDGPVSSVRFELLRKGIEDYVYLSMLEELGDRSFAQEQIRSLVTDVRTFSRDVEMLYKARKNMAKRLEELN